MITGVLAGTFEVIHPGYIAAFKEAKEYCDELVILLNEEPKGKSILSTWQRAEILLSIVYVDSVAFYRGEAELEKILLRMHYDIRFLGDDYRGIRYTGRTDIPIHYLDRSHGWSATKFKQMIADSIKEKS